MRDTIRYQESQAWIINNDFDAFKDFNIAYDNVSNRIGCRKITFENARS